MSDVSVRAVVSGFDEGERSVKALGDEFKRLESQAKAPVKSLEDLDRALNSIQELQKKGAITSIEAERRSTELGTRFSALTDVLGGTNAKFSELGKAAATAAGDAAGLGGVRRAADATSEAMESAGLAISGTTVLMGVALVAGVYKAVSAVVDAVNTTREFGAELHNLSQRTGLTAEALSGYRVITDASGLSVESFSTTLERFSRKIAAAQKGTEDGTSAFERMGISIYSSNGTLKDTDTLLSEVADKFAGYENGANKTALAIELFDRAGARMIPMLNKGAEGLSQMKEEARLAGIVMSGETAEAADKLNENMAVLKSYGEGFWQGVASPIIDGLSKITTAMREARQEGDGFFGSLMAGMRRAWAETFFDNTGDKLTDVNTQIAQTTSTINRMESGKVRGIDQASLAASYERLQELYRQQGLLEQQAADETTSFGGSFSKGKGAPAPPPIAKPKKAKDVKSMEDLELGLDSALSMALESERQYYKELKELEQISAMDYRRMLDQQMDDTEEGSRDRMLVEKAFKAFVDEQNKEYLRGEEHLTKREIALTKEKTAAERAESAETLQILREQYNERARAIQMDTTLSAVEKNRAMQDLADELVWYKDLQTSKAEVDDMERALRRQGRDIEARETMAFYGGIKRVVSSNLFDLVKGTKGMGDAMHSALIGVFDSILRKATDFVADKAVDYVLVLLGLKNGTATGSGVGGLLAPVFSAFSNLSTSIGATVGNIGTSIGTMTATAGSFISDLASGAWSVLSDLGSSLLRLLSSVAGNFSGIVGSVGSALGSVVSSVGSGISGIGNAISGLFGGGGATAAADLGFWEAGMAGGGAATGGGLISGVAAAAPWAAALVAGASLMGFWDDAAPVYGPGTTNPPGSKAYEEYMYQSQMKNIQQTIEFGGSAGEFESQYQRWLGGATNWYATGTDRIVTSPTMFGAGEAGPERVTISPLSGAGRHGMGSGTAVNFSGPVVMDYYTMRQFVRSLEKYR